MQSGRSWRVVTMLACVAALSLCGGCTLLGVAAQKLSGSTKVPPAFVLPKEPTLVLVDRPVNFDMVSLDAQRIARDITAPLEQKQIAPMVDASKAADARSRGGPDGRKLRPTEIAAACGARQIIYVEMGRFDTSKAVGGDALDGHADAVVWVVDVTTGKVRWPAEANRGQSVSAEVPFTPLAGGVSEQSVHEQLDAALAEKISRLFTGYSED